MPVYRWSQTASSNSNSDPNFTWAEGQVPSSVNDSARAQTAELKKYFDDIAGAIVSGGTSTAYTVTSYSNFDSLAHLSGQIIAFSPHATNGATVTLNVDGLGAKPLRSAPSIELQAGTIVQGTPYVCLYNNSDGVFYLRDFISNPYNVPLLGGMDFWDTIAPNSSFIFPAGQAVSRTTYATAFARWGTTYGAGDGSTTFNVPDKTGRVSAMKEASGTRLTTAGAGVDGGTMGSAGGAQNEIIAQGNLPNVSFAVSGAPAIVPASPQAIGNGQSAVAITNGTGAPAGSYYLAASSVTVTASAGTLAVASGGSGTALKTTQPTIICNYIIRII